MFLACGTILLLVAPPVPCIREWAALRVFTCAICQVQLKDIATGIDSQCTLKPRETASLQQETCHFPAVFTFKKEKICTFPQQTENPDPWWQHWNISSYQQIRTIIAASSMIVLFLIRLNQLFFSCIRSVPSQSLKTNTALSNTALISPQCLEKEIIYRWGGMYSKSDLPKVRGSE